RIAGLAVGRTRLVLGAVGHDHSNVVVVRMDVCLHRYRLKSNGRRGARRAWNWCWGLHIETIHALQGHGAAIPRRTNLLPPHSAMPISEPCAVWKPSGP